MTKRARTLEQVRQLAEGMKLRIVENGHTLMVTDLGRVIFKANDVNSVQLFLELRRASA